MPLPEFPTFNDFSLLCLNEDGQFVDLPESARSVSDGTPISAEALPEFLSRRIYLRKGVTTDVFVWVHGWRNPLGRAIATARRLFGNLNAAIVQSTKGKATSMVPAFVAVQWPSSSSPTPAGYEKIRDRAARLTDKGDAEFFLASLLGYLEGRNERTKGGKVLKARGGYYVHCIGHSFGCRFLTAAIRAAGHPQARTLTLSRALGVKERRTLSVRSERLFEFTVDSVCFLQMAAPAAGFSDQLTLLADESPLRGPVALTHTQSDRATCFWHKRAEGEFGIGCEGARKPARFIGRTVLRPPNQPYTAEDFSNLIVNIDANAVYTDGGLRPEGAHSDLWHPETIHLILTLADRARP
jgi:hypothetical protein